MQANAICQNRSRWTEIRTFVSVSLVFSLSILSGCAGGLAQSFEQSLSIVVPKQVDFAELEYYAVRSKSAYDPISKIRNEYPLVTRAAIVQSVDVLYFIETDTANRKQTLSIRGTAEKANVWDDLEAALIPDSILGVPLHHGFQKDALAIYEDAIPHLRKDFPLRITGHSLGGAVAMILGAYFDSQGYRVERVVTFGQPKFATEQPPEGIFSVTTRVVNDLDVVPMVPPHTVARQYQHFSSEVILRDGPDYVFLNEHDADRLSVGEFWRNISHLSTKDHHIGGYLANIQGKRKNGSRQVPYLFKENSEVSSATVLN